MLQHELQKGVISFNCKSYLCFRMEEKRCLKRWIPGWHKLLEGPQLLKGLSHLPTLLVNRAVLSWQ